MSDIRCPMCGKPNPAENEICQYCQARLKPLNVNAAPASSGEPEVPGWLSSLRDSEQEGQPEPEQAGGGADWLTGLRSESGTDGDDTGTGETDLSEAVSSIGSGGNRQVPDWLKGILPEPEDAESSADELSEPEAAPEESQPDNLLRYNQPQAEQAPYEQVPLPDWLSDFERPSSADQETGGTFGAIPPAVPEPTIPEPARPEWGAEKPLPPIPEWLLPEPQKPEATQAAIPEEPTAAAPALPDWMAEETHPPLPEWMTPPPATPQPSQPAIPEEAPAQAAAMPDWMAEKAPTEAPDWLKGSGEPPTPPAPAPQAEQPPAEDEFAFLKDIPAEPEEEALAGISDQEVSFPDWLKGITQQSETPVVEEPAGQPGEMPQWPSASGAEPAEQGLPVQEAGEAGELPDWLTGVDQSQQAQDEASGVPDWLAKENIPAQAAPPYPGAETPAWLPPAAEVGTPAAGGVAPFDFSDLEGGVESAELTGEYEAEEPAEPPQPELAQTAQLVGPPKPPPADLAWLAEMEATLPGMAPVSDRAEAAGPDYAAAQTGAPLGGEPGAYPSVTPLPSWLAQAAEPHETPPVEETPEAADAGLAPVELPAWLKSMQPTTIEGQAQEQAEKDQLEGSGPLIGLKGILPAEPDIVTATKPPVYSLRLKVSDLQQSHAAMLVELVQAEGEVKPLAGASLFTSQGLLRIAIAVVLFLAILLPLVAGIPTLVLPNLSQSPEVFTASQTIAGAPDNPRVLVAVDYAPGFSGDVSPLLAAIVDHLATKGARLAMVSTLPTGPLQIESLVAQVKARPGFTLPVNYANLGVITGGPAGIQAFIQSPAQALPGPWVQLPAMSGIQSLGDFNLVVVASESPETARMWIEQVHPAFPNTPVVMALSAQAKPLIQPYFNASPQQIQGLMGGYSAALLYDSAIGRTTNSAALWSPFATGLTVAVVLMVIGMLVNLLWGALRRAKDKAGSTEKA